MILVLFSRSRIYRSTSGEKIPLETFQFSVSANFRVISFDDIIYDTNQFWCDPLISSLEDEKILVIITFLLTELIYIVS